MFNSRKDDSDYKKLVTFTVEQHGNAYKFKELDFKNYNPYGPLKIYIVALGYYKMEEWGKIEDEKIDPIKNLFKHKIPFHSRSYSIQEHGNYQQEESLYRSILIKDPPAMHIENSGDIYDKVEPFLHHLASKHIATEHEGYIYIYR